MPRIFQYSAFVAATHRGGSPDIGNAWNPGGRSEPRQLDYPTVDPGNRS